MTDGYTDHQYDTLSVGMLIMCLLPFLMCCIKSRVISILKVETHQKANSCP